MPSDRPVKPCTLIMLFDRSEGLGKGAAITCD